MKIKKKEEKEEEEREERGKESRVGLVDSVKGPGQDFWH